MSESETVAILADPATLMRMAQSDVELVRG